MIIYQHRITREDLQNNRGTLYVFGDNLKRIGYGGQAAAMRGEPNAVGIPTKHEPNMRKSSFFTDDDLVLFWNSVRPAHKRLLTHAAWGGRIVVPADGIGTGLAQLPTRAPKIMEAIERIFATIEEVYRGR